MRLPFLSWFPRYDHGIRASLGYIKIVTMHLQDLFKVLPYEALYFATFPLASHIVVKLPVKPQYGLAWISSMCLTLMPSYVLILVYLLLAEVSCLRAPDLATPFSTTAICTQSQSCLNAAQNLYDTPLRFPYKPKSRPISRSAPVTNFRLSKTLQLFITTRPTSQLQPSSSSKL